MLFRYNILFYVDNSPVITSDVIDKIKCLPTTSGNDKKALSVETVTESTSETCLQPTQLMDVLSSTANLVKGSLPAIQIFIIVI